ALAGVDESPRGERHAVSSPMARSTSIVGARLYRHSDRLEPALRGLVCDAQAADGIFHISVMGRLEGALHGVLRVLAVLAAGDARALLLAPRGDRLGA